ncbi:hypothetical protein G3I59_43485 [Amycolatopsis rubida]|uniref:Creatinase N-terminal domain-containing protein n=1 Tax=Amycolatopsis rubida TaxID=112413 RepID=A0ABX0C4Q7_9PSEU|nr:MULTISPECIES: hypothetical protein [Amycolatopsis]MYW97304.1 hypothetical protein [Amycolatopsis rubida]NEC62289.1 hypothetical protein [Amycolatopsis rubida]OAP20648.1 hypothetical protein A4R44_08501 [Amycolatopsis sp. M39]
MPVSSKIRERCRGLLAEGDVVQYVFPATSLMVTMMAAHRNFLVVVTDRHVTVLTCSTFRRWKPVSVWAQLPRSTELGPVDLHPSLGPTVSFGDLVLEIEDEYVAAVRAADLERSEDALPKDPF